MKKADAVIIGFGKGGKTLASTLAGAGNSVILVEKSSKMYGGTCINAACIPTKSLIHSAYLSALQGGSFEQKASRYAEAVDKKNDLTAMLRAKNYHKPVSYTHLDVYKRQKYDAWGASDEKPVLRHWSAAVSPLSGNPAGPPDTGAVPANRPDCTHPAGQTDPGPS